MPVIQVNDQRYSLKLGQTRLGGGSDVDVAVVPDASLGVQAILELTAANQAVIRRASDRATVKVNGIPLGVEPTPLIHGDKVEVAGQELLFAEDAKGGATQYVSAGEIAAMAAQKKSAAAGRPTTATGGRLVSLVDGKEYSIGAAGVVMGRDAGCDVVIAQSEVSRRHAQITPTDSGYVVSDNSTNGVFVNGERIDGSRLLARADVVRVGTEEFRFYADLAQAPRTTSASAPAPAAPAAPTPASAPAMPDIDLELAMPEPVAPKAARPAAPAVAAAQVAPAAPVAPPTPPPVAPMPSAAPVAPSVPTRTDTRPVLATLEVLNDVLKGTMFELRTPLSTIGRGDHNDVQVKDESVSDTHAKLQRRADEWYVIDLESTNGTYVGGTRISGERRLEGSPDLRFGGIKMTFRPAQGAAETGKGTRAIAGVSVAQAMEMRKGGGAQQQAATPAPAPARQGGIPMWIWIVAVLLIAGAGAALVLMRR